MESLSTGRVADTLRRLFAQAEQADRPLMEQFADMQVSDQYFAEHLAEERRDVRGFYRGYADNFLNVAPEYGRFLYGGEVDLVLLDGAFSLYLPVLKLLEPHLKPGALILAENAFDFGNEYLDYVRDPANGYLSQPIPVSEGRGNEFTVSIR